MMTCRHFALFGSLLLLVAIEVARAEGQVVTAPAPRGCATSLDYTVKVNGQPLAVYAAPVWYPQDVVPYGGPYAFASFDFQGKVEVEITSTRSLDHVVIQPESRNIRPTVEGKTLRFTLERPCQLSIEPDAKRGPLLLFANPLEENRPDPSDPKVKYFGPGLHKVDMIELGDNETLYLAAGAVVQGGVWASGKNIRICGRGILDGGLWERWKGPRPFYFELFQCQNVTVEGIIFKDSWGWVLMLSNSQDVTIRNVKLCSTRCENNDGIDVTNSSRVTLTDSFMRTDDDCICTKGYGERFGAAPYPPVEDFLVERCVLWTDRANVWRLGCESRASAMRRLTFRDLDVIHYAHPTNPVFRIQPMEEMPMEEVRFENIRIHHEGQPRFLCLDVCPTRDTVHYLPGTLRNVVFKDIVLTGRADGHLGEILFYGADERHPIENVVLENVVRHGQRVRADSPELERSGKVSGVEFR